MILQCDRAYWYENSLASLLSDYSIPADFQLINDRVRPVNLKLFAVYNETLITFLLLKFSGMTKYED
jgi:hypothetical protein